MAELVQDNWVLVVAALIVLLLVAWWVFAASRRTRVEIAPGDRDESAPARRNQALIDAPPAAARDLPVPTPAGLAGIGEAVSAAAPPAPQSAPPPATAEPKPESPREPEGSASAPASPAAPDAPAAAGEADELLRIKGLGPKLAERLNALGVTSLAQIAAWDDAEMDRIDAQLGRFQGRIRRDDWREQARLLTAGDRAGYEARFGRL